MHISAAGIRIALFCIRIYHLLHKKFFGGTPPGHFQLE